MRIVFTYNIILYAFILSQASATDMAMELWSSAKASFGGSLL